MIKVVFRKKFSQLPEGYLSSPKYHNKQVEYYEDIEKEVNKIVKVNDSTIIPFPRLENEYHVDSRGNKRVKKRKLVVDDFSINLLINTKYNTNYSGYYTRLIKEYFSDDVEYFNLYLYDTETKEFYVNYYKVYIKDKIEIKPKADSSIKFDLDLGVIGFYTYNEGDYDEDISLKVTKKTEMLGLDTTNYIRTNNGDKYLKSLSYYLDVRTDGGKSPEIKFERDLEYKSHLSRESMIAHLSSDINLGNVVTTIELNNNFGAGFMITDDKTRKSLINNLSLDEVLAFSKELFMRGNLISVYNCKELNIVLKDNIYL